MCIFKQIHNKVSSQNFVMNGRTAVFHECLENLKQFISKKELLKVQALKRVDFQD